MSRHAKGQRAAGISVVLWLIAAALMGVAIVVDSNPNVLMYATVAINLLLAGINFHAWRWWREREERRRALRGRP